MRFVLFIGLLLSRLENTGLSQTAKSAAESKAFGIKDHGSVDDGNAILSEAVRRNIEFIIVRLDTRSPDQREKLFQEDVEGFIER